MSKDLRLKDIAMEESKMEAERYRNKYEKQLQNNQEAENEIEDLKRDRADWIRNFDELEASYKAEKEKISKYYQQILGLQKEAKEWKYKAEVQHDEGIKIKEQCYQLKARIKNEERNIVSELERMTHDYNNLQGILKQKEQQLAFAKRKPLE